LFDFVIHILNPGCQLDVGSDFFMHNIHIAWDRAWAQMQTSRAKGPEFWEPYVEEWDVPPPIDQSEDKMQGLAWATG
jgi:hypothetical protein